LFLGKTELFLSKTNNTFKVKENLEWILFLEKINKLIVVFNRKAFKYSN